MKKFIFACVFSAFCLGGTISTRAQTDIKSVDFKNFTFRASCAGEEETVITVKNGEFMKETKMSDDYIERFFFKIDDPVYGDLTGDGKDEAVILSICNTGGTGQFSEGFVYTLKNDKPALLTRILGGDRADGGLREARIESGLLAIDSNEGSAACCTEFVITTKYRLNLAKLIEVGKPTKRELYPAIRITFTKGAASSTVTAEIPAYDMKRFVVGARAGQTLTLKTAMKEVSFRIFKGEVEESELPNGLRAKLLANGDYVFEIANDSDANMTVSATVEIK